MHTNIRWKDIDKSDAVVHHLEEKLVKIIDFLFDEEQIKVEFVHYRKIHKFKTRLNLVLKSKKLIRAEAESDDIFTSINLAVLKANDQIRRDKTKHEK
ncbi:MAG: HPF/RaiA family ribosome-associated protein [Malacoplasma sp.]